MISDNGRSSGVVQSGRTRPSPQGRATSSFSSSPSSTTNDFPNGPRSTTKTTQSSTASSSSTAATAPTSSRPQAILLSSVVPSGDFCVLCAHSTTNYHIASLSSASASTISASSSLGTLDQPQPVQQTPPRRQGCDHHTGSMYPPYNRAPSDSQVLTKRCPYHHQKTASLDLQCASCCLNAPKAHPIVSKEHQAMAAVQPPPYESTSPPVTLVIPESKWTDVKFSLDLVTASQREANFLRMIDRKAPVLYDEQFVRNAVRRYEQYWLPLQAKLQDCNVVPPLDVHWVWHTHMLSPQHYIKDCSNLVGTLIDHKLLSPEEIQERYQRSVKAWEAYCPSEPYDFVASSKLKLDNNYIAKSSYDIAGAIQRQRNFNYQISLPHYTSPKFLAEAVQRYQKFLFLKIHYPDEFLTPCYDFDVVWHSHQVHPAVYAQDMQRLLGKVLKHDDSVNDRGAGSKLLRGEAMTKKLWNHHFPGETFWRRGAMYRGHWAPAFLGFDQQDLSNITYGNVHIPCITLKEIPVHREQLKLKLSYGSKKVTTFNADLANKDTTKDGFCLVWQPAENGGGMSSVVHFPFERKHPKDLVIELELYDKLFLQKKDLARLVGRSPLEELLPPSNSKSVQNTANLSLLEKDKDGVERSIKAKVGITTSLSLTRELQLTVGEFVNRDLPQESRLFELCRSAALNKSGFNTSNKYWVAAHSLVDPRDNVQYIVQVVHSSPALLSVVLVFGKDQRLLAMAHLIGSDTLPSKDQLDTNLQFLPHLSSAEERAMVIMNCDGDFAIIKGKWSAFQKRVQPSKGGKGKPGNPGKLTVEAFNLLKNTVQKFDIPGAEGTTMFMLGDAQARLPGKRIQCRSTYVAEHLACVFSVSILFVLCNPDKIRTRSESTAVGLQCHKWPLILAAGYGKENPSNRYLAAKSQGDSSAANEDDFMFACAPLMMAEICDVGGDMGAGCGACGACGGCGACGACGGCGSCGGCGGCGGCG